MSVTGERSGASDQSGHSHMHSHSHGHSHGHDHVHPHHTFEAGTDPAKALTKAMLITGLFMVIEAVGGVWSNSLALLSDAGHMATDLGALALSAFALWLSKRPSTRANSFGYRRAEVLGAFVSGILIWAMSAFLAYEAVVRFSHPEPVQGAAVFWIAIIGLAANLASLRALHSAQRDNLNIRAAYLHVLTDAAGSFGAILVGLVIWLTGWTPIDLLVSLIVVASTTYGAWSLIKRSTEVLMQFAPSHLDVARIYSELCSLPGVQEVHDLHVWSLNGMDSSLSVHLVAQDQESVLAAANQLLEKQFGVRHTTIQVEHPDRFDRARCFDCESSDHS
jgi:cobalt-zinc-cadmium efflux system protein